MNVETLSKLMNNAKAIYAVMFLVAAGMYNGIIWAADQRYLQTANYEKREVVKEIRQLNYEIAKYETQLLYEKDADKKAMINALIINVKKEIKNLKGE